MAQGRHRKPRESHPDRMFALVAAIALVVGAAVTVGMTNDPRYLRIATVAALVGALLPSTLLRPTPRVESAQETELVALRLEVARLRADVVALQARPRAPERVATTLRLPLVRAALTHSDNGWATVNGNGHARTVDLTVIEGVSPATTAP